MKLLKIFSAYLIAGIFLTLGFLGNFQTTDEFLSFLGLSSQNYSVNLAFISVTIFPGLLIAYLITNWALLEYVNEEKDNFKLEISRGFSTRSIIISYLPKITILALVGTIFGFFLSFLIYDNRLNYKNSIFINDLLIGRQFDLSLSNDYFAVVIIIIECLLFLSFSLRHLFSAIRLPYSRIEGVKDKRDSPIFQEIIKNGLIVMICFFFLLELVRMDIDIEHPLIVTIVILSVVVLLLSTDKTIYLILTGTLSLKLDTYDYNAKEPIIGIRKGLHHTYFSFFRILLNLLIAIITLYFAIISDLGELSNLIIVAIVGLIILFIIQYLSRRAALTRTLERATWLKRKANNPKIFFTFLTLFFTLLIWQSSSYATISDIGVGDAYFENYGADIRVALYYSDLVDITRPPSVTGWDPEINRQLVYDRDPDNIDSVLRYFINTQTAAAPTADTVIDILMFNASQYLEDGFYLRDDWFIGGTASELFVQLNNDSSNIILDSNHARLLNKKIGDTFVLNPFLREEGRNFEFTIIGLVDFFPSDSSNAYSVSSSLYHPYAIIDLQAATPQFQDPDGGANPINRMIVSYWLIKTTDTANRTAVLEEIKRSTTDQSDVIQFMDIHNSATVEESISSSTFLDQTFQYQQSLGVSQIIVLILLLLLGFMFLVQWNSDESESDQRFLLKSIGINDNQEDLVRLLQQIILVSFSLLLGVIVGTLFTTSLLQLILPTSTQPFKSNFSYFLPALIAYVILIFLVIILYFERLYLKIDLLFLKTLSHIVIILGLLSFPIIGGDIVERNLYSDLILDQNILLVISGAIIFLVLALILFQQGLSFFNGGKKNSKIEKFNKSFYVLIKENMLSILMNAGFAGLLIYFIAFTFDSSIEWLETLLIFSIFLLFISLVLSIFLYRSYIISLRFNWNWILYYRMLFKKLIQNRQRLLLLTSGLILALALISGVSIHVDTVSQKVVNDYFKSSDRFTDIFADIGENTIN
ncbi:MAG: hypothetical protein ACXAC7_17755, partial [Candidatus Hodarchaeales archaeon]